MKRQPVNVALSADEFWSQQAILRVVESQRGGEIGESLFDFAYRFPFRAVGLDYGPRAIAI
jgi:hypothetical protein